MHGLVSLLPEPYSQRVEDLWTELETCHGLQGIRVTPFAHFSWQIAWAYDFAGLEAVLHELAAVTHPFSVRTCGLGLFTGLRPVLYIPVVKDAALVRLHAAIWEAAQPHAERLSPYYGPTQWMPHISLAYEDLDEENIGSIMQTLVSRSFNWEMCIDNLAAIYEPEGETGALKFILPLARTSTQGA